MGEEYKVLQDMHTATDRTLDLLRSRHQAILRKIAQNDKSRLHILGDAVELLTDHEPGSQREVEATVREAERLIKALRRERDIILRDPDAPRELVRPIDQLLERARKRLSLLKAPAVPLPPPTPDLRGRTIPEAEQEHADLRLRLAERGTRYSSEPLGKIVDQDPKPDTPLPRDRRVGVWLSRGQEQTPDLLHGMTVDEAKAKYPRIRVIHDARRDEFSNAWADTIIGQTPSPNDPLPRDRRVGVWVSLGPPEPEPLTPDLRGRTIPEAEQEHADLRLRLAERGKRYSLEPTGKIVDQDPKPDTPLPLNRLVGVWLSQSVWPLLLVGIASVVVVVGLLLAVLRWIRLDGRRLPTERSPVHFRPHPDPGNQVVEAEAGEWALPSISVRFRMDRGVQEIEQSPMREEE